MILAWGYKTGSGSPIFYLPISMSKYVLSFGYKESTSTSSIAVRHMAYIDGTVTSFKTRIADATLTKTFIAVGY